MGIDNSSLLYGAAVLTASNVLSQVLGFIYRIFLSRMVVAETMGLYQLVMPVYSVLLSVCVSGLTVAAARLAAEFGAMGRKGMQRELMRRCIAVFFVLTGLCAVLLLTLSGGISEALIGDGRTKRALMLLLPVMALTGIENICKNYFYGVNRIIAPAVVEVFEMLIRMTSVLGLIRFLMPEDSERALTLIVAGMIACEIFSSSALLLSYRRYTARFKRPELSERRGLLKRIAGIALPVAATSLLSNLIATANSVLIPARLTVSGLGQREAVSLFGAVFGMTLPTLSLPMVFVAGLSLIMVPKLSESRALGDIASVRRKISKSLLVVCILSIPVCAMFIPLGSEIIVFLFGEPAAGDYVTPLALCLPLSGIAAITGSVLNGVGRQSAAARNFILGGLLQLAFTYVGAGMPGVRLYGFIAGYALSGVLICVLNLSCIVRETGLKLRYYSWFVAPALSSVLAALVANYIYMNMKSGAAAPLLYIIVSIVSGFAVYAVTELALGFRLSALIRRGQSEHQ